MMDTIRAFVPGQDVTFVMQGADGESDRYRANSDRSGSSM